MKKTLIAAGIALSALSSARAGTYLSVGATGASFSTEARHMAFSADFFDQLRGTKTRILSAQIERRFAFKGGYMIAPSLSVGRYVIADFAADEVAAGLRVAKQITQAFCADAGLRLGRTLRAPVPGLYRSAFVGVSYKIGHGYLSVDYSKTLFPAAIGAWTLRGIAVGYQFAF